MLRVEDLPPLSLAHLIAEDRRYWERMMDNTDDVRWALLDLLKELARIYSDNSADAQWLGPYGPEFQAELRRIAKTLGVELPPLPHEGNGKLAIGKGE